MKRIARIIFFLLVASFAAACSGEQEVSEISLNPETLELKPGETYRLEAVCTPSGAAASLQWSSSDESVVTVDPSGTVTASAPGQAVVTVVSGLVSASCRIAVVDPRPASIGDYYYSDGTWGEEPDPAKEVLGVVFWVGDPTADDEALAREHPGCTHGLVVSVDGDDLCAWQRNYAAYGKTVGEWIDRNLTDYISVQTGTGPEDNLNRMLGYNHTKAMECFNAAPENAAWPVTAVERTVAYRNYKPAPAASSDWYLPSAKELSLLCSGEQEGNVWDIRDKVENRDLINGRLLRVYQAQQLAEERYWSSSEGDIIRSFYINFASGLPNITYVKDTEYLRIRYVLAF